MTTTNGQAPGEVTPDKQEPVQTRPANAVISHDQLPNAFAMAHARLPDAYMVAKMAIANCAKMDECMDWANKAEALASYARQSNDDTLQKHAIRIQARAIHRCGILLKEVAPSGGGRPASTHTDPDTSLTRTQAAKDAGLSKRQKDTALRVANVDEAEFEAAVESANPPTVAQIAEAGTKRKPIFDLEGIQPEIFTQATDVQGALRSLAECCKKIDPAEVTGGFLPHEVPKIKVIIQNIEAWLGIFIKHLEADSKVPESGTSLKDQYTNHRKEVATLAESAKAKLERLTQAEFLLLQESFRAEVRKEFERTVPERLEEVAKQEKRLTYEIRKYQMMRDGIGQFWTEEEYKLVMGVCHPDRESPKERKDKAFILLRKLDSYFSTLKAVPGLKI